MKENDFGFSFMDESEVAHPNEIEREKKRAGDIYRSVLPLLENLEKNPEKAIINWPNRAAQIKEFKAKLIQILNEK